MLTKYEQLYYAIPLGILCVCPYWLYFIPNVLASNVEPLYFLAATKQLYIWLLSVGQSVSLYIYTSVSAQ